MHGFKSFKKCHVEFSPHITAIVGPNGSGKSNIIDAIMFVLGESSLSKMRSDKLQGLINNRSTHATVVLTLEDGEKEYRMRRSRGRLGRSTDSVDLKFPPESPARLGVSVRDKSSQRKMARLLT